MTGDLITLFQWWELERHRTMPRANLVSLQSRRLRRLVRHAALNVPFYGRLFERTGVRPEDVQGVADLARLPLVQRADLQSATLRERSSRAIDSAACVIRRTGGSSGVPLAVVSGRQELAFETLVWLRTWRRFGLRASDLQVTIKDPEDATPWNRRHWYHSFRLLRVRYLDIHAAPDLLARALVDLQPDVLRGPPSILAAIAPELGSSGPPSRLRLVFTTGERLEPETRKHLEAALAAPVHDLYGATEAGCIAWRCPACAAYHVNSDTALVEVLNNGAPAQQGEIGAIVITNLFARTMPFIRYQLGDLAELGPSCPKAPGCVTLRSLSGRTTDPLIGADGRLLSPYTFMPDEIEGIAQYRVIQERPDLVRVLVVPGACFQADALERARRKYQQRLGTRCRIEFELRESLAPAGPRDGEASPHPPDALVP